MAQQPDVVDSPTELPGTSWRDVAKRVVKESQRDHLTDWAAALTYYGVMAIFPGMLVLVAVLGLLGPSATTELVDTVGAVAPGEVRDFLAQVIDNAQQAQGAAGLIAIVGLLIALWSASGYIAAFMRASNAIYDVGEGRPIWKTLPTRVVVTVVVVIMLVVSAAIVVLSGDIATQVGEAIGLGDTAVTIWNIVKWPVLLFIASTILAVMYWACPNVRPPNFRWVSPGGIFGVVVWLIASFGFALYVANVSDYARSYGSVAGVIVFLVWLWISNMALLLGAELNAELERARAIRAGLPPQQEPFTDIRDTRKLQGREKEDAERTRQLLADAETGDRD